MATKTKKKPGKRGAPPKIFKKGWEPKRKMLYAPENSLNAIKKASDNAEISANTWINRAILEKLARDGYHIENEYSYYEL